MEYLELLAVQNMSKLYVQNLVTWILRQSLFLLQKQKEYHHADKDKF
jgi:hypothetical protein